MTVLLSLALTFCGPLQNATLHLLFRAEALFKKLSSVKQAFITGSLLARNSTEKVKIEGKNLAKLQIRVAFSLLRRSIATGRSSKG